MKPSSLSGLIGILSLVSHATIAQDVWVWDGGGNDNNFTTAANWVGDTKPEMWSRNILQFTGSQRLNPNNNESSTVFQAWHVLDSAGGPFTIGGNPTHLLALTNESSHLFTVSCDLNTAGGEFDISLFGGDILLNGVRLGMSSITLNTLNVWGWGSSARSLMLRTEFRATAQTKLVVNSNANVVLEKYNYYGETTVNSGRVQVGTGGTSGTLGLGATTMKAGTVLSFNRSDIYEMDRPITLIGSGTYLITQDGTGETRITHNSDSPGAGAQVNAGTLVLGRDSSSSVHTLNASALVKSPGTLRIAGSGGDQIADSASVTLEGGTLDLASSSETIASLSGDGKVDVSNPDTASTLKFGSASSIFFGQLCNSGDNALNLQKAGAGTFTLSDAVSPMRGTIAILGGRLELANGAALPNVPSITLNSNTWLRFTGSGTVPAGQTISGHGAIEGSPVIAGTLQPGGNDAGTLTLSNSPTLQGTLEMQILSNGADKLVTPNLLTYGGKLKLLTGSVSFEGGESFDLFDAGSFSGSFSQTQLPTLGAGLNWWLGRLTNTGAIVVNRAPAILDVHTVTRAPGISLKIPARDLRGHWSDPDSADGDTMEIDAITSSGNAGAIVSLQGSGDQTYIYYVPGNNTNDTLTYRIRDARGGSASGGQIRIEVKAATSVIQNIYMQNGKPLLKLAGIPGYRYAVERSTSPGFSSFENVHEFTAPEGVYEWLDNTASGPGYYYRLKAL